MGTAGLEGASRRRGIHATRRSGEAQWLRALIPTALLEVWLDLLSLDPALLTRKIVGEHARRARALEAAHQPDVVAAFLTVAC